jgi:hypothetical protein
MKVLAFDVATVTGVAFGCSGSKPRAWEVNLGKGAAEQARFSKAINLARWACEKFEPDLVAIEAPVGGTKTSHLLVGMWACIMGECHRASVRSIKCDIASVRKHFLGKHLTAKHYPHLKPTQAKLEIKRAVITRCRLLGWQAETDNCGDALAIWDYACSSHDPSHHTTTIGGLFQ